MNPRLLATVVVELATHGTRERQRRVGVGVEGRRVVLDLLNVETIAGVDTVGEKTRLEGALEAADAVLAALARGVGERDAARRSMVSGQLLWNTDGHFDLPRRASLAQVTLVDVCSRGSGR